MYTSKNLIQSTINGKNTKKLNSSFHKIYTDETGSDISDESETEIDRSQIYSSSPNSVKLFDAKSSHHQLNGSILSLNSTKSTSPQFITGSTIYENPRSVSSSLYNQSIYSSTHDLRNIRPNFDDNILNRSFNNYQIPFSNPNYHQTTNLNDSFYSLSSQSPFEHTNNSNITQIFNNNSRIINPNSFNLDSMKLGGLNNSSNKTLFTSDYQNDRCPSSLSMRSSILCPSRLGNVTFGAPTQSSWVAGGFWGQQASPKKNVIQQPTPLSSRLNVDFCPIVSRTSSQSSGFESMHQNNNNLNHMSRSSSVCGDDIDRFSLFSESNNFQNNFKSFGSLSNNNNVNDCNKSAFSFKSMKNDLPNNIPKGRLLKDWINRTNSISDIKM